MGLKPPSRGRMVATGRLTAVEVEARRWAGGHPPLAGVAEVAVEALQDRVDHDVVHAAVVGVAWLVMMSVRGLSRCPKPMVRPCPWASPSGHTSSGVATKERLLIEAKMA